jgi:hypothetical protein
VQSKPGARLGAAQVRVIHRECVGHGAPARMK